MASSGGVDGYEAIDVPFTQNFWGGLEYNGHQALLDGSVDYDYRWYAVGTSTSLYSDHSGTGYPGPDNKVVQQVELYACVESGTTDIL